MQIEKNLCGPLGLHSSSPGLHPLLHFQLSWMTKRTQLAVVFGAKDAKLLCVSEIRMFSLSYKTFK